MYLPIVRDFVPDVLDVFDFAEPSLVVAARDVTNVPSQALYLMNNPFVSQQSRAHGASASSPRRSTDPQRIDLAYRLALSRPPTDAERAARRSLSARRGDGLLAAKPASNPKPSETSWATFCQALFACAEFRYLTNYAIHESRINPTNAAASRPRALTRRDLLKTVSAGFGWLAFKGSRPSSPPPKAAVRSRRARRIFRPGRSA